MSRARRGGALAMAAVLALGGCAGTSGTADPTTVTRVTAPPTTTATAPPTTVAPTTAPPTTAATTTTVARPPTTAQPRVPHDPAALSDALVADERALRDPATAEADRTAAARRQQVAYRLLGNHPEWDAVVMPRIPPDLAPAMTRNVDARRQFVAMGGDYDPPEELPAWTIVAPVAADQLRAWYDEAAAASGVGWQYLASINLVETGVGRIVGPSSAGAQGPMQFMPSTWERYGNGADIHDPHASILAAGRFLAANGFADDVDGALFRYNNDVRYVQAVRDYAEVLAAEPDLFAASYHRWQIFFHTVEGDVLLPVGYHADDVIPVADYLAAHPQ